MARQVNTGLVLTAGTTTQAPLTFSTGSLLATPVAGSEEYNGSFHYLTPDTTSGRAFVPSTWVHRATAGTAVGPATAAFFGADSSINLESDSTYVFEYFCSFLKSTAGTVTFSLLASSPLLLLNADSVASPAAGSGAAGAPQFGYAGAASGATVAAFPASASLSSGVNHYSRIRGFVRTNTACNLRLRITGSAGTITRNADSFYTITRVPNASTGSFAT